MSVKWTVIGAGPAGIAAVGKLMDEGIKDIIWIDKDFDSGNLSKFKDVPSNTRAGLFCRFLMACESFRMSPSNLQLFSLPKDKTCNLKHVVEGLEWATAEIRNFVYSAKCTVKSIEEGNGFWLLKLSDNTTIESNNVILATGGTPKITSWMVPDAIPLERVLNFNKCQETFRPDDTVAVYGSSHSAILAIKNLVNLPVKQIVNIYKSPLKFAVHFKDHILFDDTGLKGEVANWARYNLVGKCPKNVVRYHTEDAADLLPYCTKHIYAIGFNPTHLRISTIPEHEYDPLTGIIGPGMFGVGMAYPELYTGRYGHQEYRVGMWKFMDYLNKIMPIWLEYAN